VRWKVAVYWNSDRSFINSVVKLLYLVVAFDDLHMKCMLYAENAETPYSATVVINDVKYGTGYASSKKAAKLDAGNVQDAMAFKDSFLFCSVCEPAAAYLLFG
jgi:Double-stranded RNA binding motif